MQELFLTLKTTTYKNLIIALRNLATSLEEEPLEVEEEKGEIGSAKYEIVLDGSDEESEDENLNNPPQQPNKIPQSFLVKMTRQLPKRWSRHGKSVREAILYGI